MIRTSILWLFLLKLWTIKSNEGIATFDQHEDKIRAMAVGASRCRGLWHTEFQMQISKAGLPSPKLELIRSTKLSVARVRWAGQGPLHPQRNGARNYIGILRNSFSHRSQGLFHAHTKKLGLSQHLVAVQNLENLDRNARQELLHWDSLNLSFFPLSKQASLLQSNTWPFHFSQK